MTYETEIAMELKDLPRRITSTVRRLIDRATSKVRKKNPGPDGASPGSPASNSTDK
jgi:hypothetical protein